MRASVTEVEEVATLLRETSETHHVVYRHRDGVDPDWASWYADWLIRLSDLPTMLQTTPVRSELIYMLVKLDRDFNAATRDESWDHFYARQLLEHFQPVHAR